MILRISLFVSAVVMIIASCEKGPGPGGTSTIRGKIIVEDYNQTYTTLWAEYDGADRDVYLIYGDGDTYGEDVKTGPDGIYEFHNLVKGEYTVYAYSKDSSLDSPSGEIAILKKIYITENKQVVNVPLITVFE